MVSVEGFGSFVRENGKKAMDAAVDAAKIAKLTADIKAEELKMYDVYKEIGKLFVEKAESEVDEEFIPLLQKIADAKAKIERLAEEKENLKNPAEESKEVPAEEEAAEEVAEESAEKAEDEAVEEEAPAEETPVEEEKSEVEEEIFAE